MKITRETGPLDSDPGRTGKRGRRVEAAAAPGTVGDTVSISAEALRRVEAAERGPAAMEPEERAQLVADLKARVGSGSYRPDLKRTALFLIRDSEETLA